MELNTGDIVWIKDNEEREFEGRIAEDPAETAKYVVCEPTTGDIVRLVIPRSWIVRVIKG